MMDFGVYESLVDDYKAVVYFYGVFICMDWDYNIIIVDDKGNIVSQPTAIK